MRYTTRHTNACSHKSDQSALFFCFLFLSRDLSNKPNVLMEIFWRLLTIGGVSLSLIWLDSFFYISPFFGVLGGRFLVLEGGGFVCMSVWILKE